MRLPAAQGTQLDRRSFAERLRVQLRSRYSGADVDIDEHRFALRVTAPGVDTRLALAPLHQACTRDPANAATLIARYVNSLERQMTPRSGTELSPQRLLWCVRNAESLAGLSRAGELLSTPVAADLVAFVAEDLPGSIMRGVPRQEWKSAGLDDDHVRAVADTNTAARFDRLLARIRSIDRVPADGWRMAGDPLYQSSVVVVAPLLGALVERAGAEVLLGVPDRGVVLAIPAGQPQAERFQRRVLQEWREAMNPCSHRVLRSDGTSLSAVPRRRARPAAMVLPWLDE